MATSVDLGVDAALSVLPLPRSVGGHYSRLHLNGRLCREPAQAVPFAVG
jgi:hypothetical protein